MRNLKKQFKRRSIVLLSSETDLTQKIHSFKVDAYCFCNSICPDDKMYDRIHNFQETSERKMRLQERKNSRSNIFSAP